MDASLYSTSRKKCLKLVDDYKNNVEIQKYMKEMNPTLVLLTLHTNIMVGSPSILDALIITELLAE